MIRVLIFALLCGCQDNTVKLEYSATSYLKVSHRGYQENSIKGFESAIIDGYTHLETDVRLRDGELVLLHDNIECYDCDALESLLVLAEQHNITLWVELKEIQAIEKGLALISKYNVNVILMSFDIEAIKIIASSSNHSVGWITYNTDNLPDIEKAIDWIVIEKSKYKLCVDYIKCAIWTVTDKDKIPAGIDAVITDLKYSE